MRRRREPELDHARCKALELAILHHAHDPAKLAGFASRAEAVTATAEAFARFLEGRTSDWSRHGAPDRIVPLSRVQISTDPDGA